eukprot:15457271-Alexandrium_andersonii.AAC.1
MSGLIMQPCSSDRTPWFAPGLPILTSGLLLCSHAVPTALPSLPILISSLKADALPTSPPSLPRAQNTLFTE